MFADFLPTLTLKTITSFELEDDEEEIDEVYWNGEPSGGFSIKSAKVIMKGGTHANSHLSRGWKELWKTPVPQRIQFFLWLVCQERFMSNATQIIRKLASDPRCIVCGYVEESAEHILRLCPSAVLVWRKMGWNVLKGMVELPLKEWVLHNLGAISSSRGEE